MSSSPSSSRIWRRALGGIKQGLAFPFPPPAIPGLGSSGGVSFVLEDRSGGNDPQFLTAEVCKFLGALGKRPEIAAAIPTYYPAVPQLYVDVDREKVAQQQVSLSDVYTTMQTFMGGSLVNYFNRFGRQWQTYIEAEGDYRTNIDNIGQFYVTAPTATACRSVRGDTVSTIDRPGVHHALQRVRGRAAHHRRRARLQFRPGDGGARTDLRADHARRHGLGLLRA